MIKTNRERLSLPYQKLKEFNDKIESEKAKITEKLCLREKIKLQINWRNEASEILKPFKREIDMLKQENRDLKIKLKDIQKSQINCLNSEETYTVTTDEMNISTKTLFIEEYLNSQQGP